jgi:hypothetical protein
MHRLQLVVVAEQLEMAAVAERDELAITTLLSVATTSVSTPMAEMQTADSLSTSK